MGDDMYKAYRNKIKKVISDDIKTKFPQITDFSVLVMGKKPNITIHGLTEDQISQLDHIRKL